MNGWPNPSFQDVWFNFTFLNFLRNEAMHLVRQGCGMLGYKMQKFYNILATFP
jgi:hypothetical protein